MPSTRFHRLHRLALVLGLSVSITTPLLAAGPPDDLVLDGDPEVGRLVANDRAKGNCVACHIMADAEGPGSLGPVLIAIQTRFPSKRELASQIWDATLKNPEAVMPPFGKHAILTQQEFVDVVEYIWTL
ncbi:sulfur oxidation c-type cytochrome SoxX [Allochromatium palmeri]|uniref:Sulfur oxidation c-type cytochrome SoxX n=1 Tax=Allochromatium palmeri TaxID=231048 RepID=A0A6N8EBY0_9GAMM|nr:sulfur oxidation c-type cytochrome SoxX [Allochromatium palmeri]MTW20047.1 sulfur oxidation c-type cytochrome SoxX [Allochromatium palmeri]